VRRFFGWIGRKALRAMAKFLAQLIGGILREAGPEFFAEFVRVLNENRGEIAKQNSDLQSDPDLAALLNPDGLPSQNDNRTAGDGV
jgi:hypothetical protein